jgi:hypothetical protein
LSNYLNKIWETVFPLPIFYVPKLAKLVVVAVFLLRLLLIFILVLILALCIGAVAVAEENDTRASDYFSGYGITLSKPGSARINITFSCSSAGGTASQIGVSNYSVYRYDESDGYWDLVSGPHSGSYSYNASSHSFAKTFQGVNGEKYRVKCVFLCTKNGTTETKSYTSRTITLP